MSPMPPVHRLRTLWAVLGTPGRVAAVSAAVAGVVLLLSVPSLLGALFTRAAPSGAEVVQDQKQQAERFSKGFEGHLAQINGRSLFFRPAPPARPDTRITTGDDAPRPPARYGGPALIGFAHDAVYFADGRRLRVGDESDPSLKVARIDPPWSAVVVWEGAEFTVHLFDRDRLVFPIAAGQDQPSTPAPDSPAGAVAPAEPAPGVNPEQTTPAEKASAAPEPAPATDTTVPPGTAGGSA